MRGGDCESIESNGDGGLRRYSWQVGWGMMMGRIHGVSKVEPKLDGCDEETKEGKGKEIMKKYKMMRWVRFIETQ